MNPKERIKEIPLEYESENSPRWKDYNKGYKQALKDKEDEVRDLIEKLIKSHHGKYVPVFELKEILEEIK